MKVELRNVKVSRFASHETTCFEAVVYIDGVKSGSVSNSGRGGGGSYSSYELQKRLTAWAKTLPKYDDSAIYSEPPGTRMEEHCAETAIGELLNQHFLQKSLKQALNKRILFTVTDQPGVFESAVLKKDMFTKLMALPPDVLKSKFLGCKTVLNLLPFDEAMKIYQEASRLKI